VLERRLLCGGRFTRPAAILRRGRISRNSTDPDQGLEQLSIYDALTFRINTRTCLLALNSLFGLPSKPDIVLLKFLSGKQ
jgi:hypothetical protein